MTKKKKQLNLEEPEGKIFPPRIDAYRWVTAANFREELEAMALEWGEQAIGRSILETGLPPLAYEEDLVLACGYSPAGNSYAAVVGADEHLPIYERDLRIIEFSIPEEWDVT